MFSWLKSQKVTLLAAAGVLVSQPFALLAACPDSPPDPTAVAAGTTSSTNKTVGPLGGSNSITQTFTAAGEGCVQLQSITISLKRTGGSSDVSIRVYKTTGGLPDFGEPLGASFNLGEPGAAYSSKTATFVPSLQLQGGELYAFVLSSDAGSSDGYLAQANQTAGSPYAGGAVYKGGDGNWEAQANRDLVMAITFTCCAVPTARGCTYSQGYWKNHAEAWPTDSLVLGGRSYNKTELLSIFHKPVGGNGLISLSYHLIAAILNGENGASIAFDVDAAMSQSHNLIGTQTVPPVDGSTAFVGPSLTGSYTSLLDDYNNGIIGPGHCSE